MRMDRIKKEEAAAIVGVWRDWTDRNGETARLKIAASGNPRYQAKYERILANMDPHVLDGITDDQRAKLYLDCRKRAKAGTVIVQWEDMLTVDNDGKAVETPYTDELCETYLLTVDRFKAIVEEFGDEEAEKRRTRVEESGKQRPSSSGGGSDGQKKPTATSARESAKSAAR